MDNKGDFEKIKKELKKYDFSDILFIYLFDLLKIISGGEKMKVLFELYQKAQYTPKELGIFFSFYSSSSNYIFSVHIFIF